MGQTFLVDRDLVTHKLLHHWMDVLSQTILYIREGDIQLIGTFMTSVRIIKFQLQQYIITV